MRFLQRNCVEAFVLNPWNPEREIRITIHALDVGLDTVLKQQIEDVQWFVDFWSSILKLAAMSYSAIKREYLVAVEVVCGY